MEYIVKKLILRQFKMIALAMAKIHAGDELIPLGIKKFNELGMATAVDITLVVLFFGITFRVNR